jgi:exosortase
MTTPTRLFAFAFLCAVSIMGMWHTLVATLHLALANEAYTHILLIVPLSGALIYFDYFDRDAVGRTPYRRSVIGMVALVCAAILAFAARWGLPNIPPDQRLSLSMFALVLWWIGSFTFSFGTQALRALLFPLGFLFWMMPIPTFLLDRIVQFLQYQSAFAARILFHAIGVPVTQDGIMLSIPTLDIEVARECSSIRSSLLLIIITMVLAHLFLHSWWRKALLVAAAIPVSVAKNGLRIVTIGELGTRVDRSFLDGRLHHHGGIVFLGIAVGIMVALLWTVRRTEVHASLKPSLESPG